MNKLFAMSVLGAFTVVAILLTVCRGPAPVSGGWEWASDPEDDRLALLGSHGTRACDSWSLSETLAILESEEQRQAELLAESETVLRRIQSKHEIVARVIAGSMSLLEAAQAFRDLNATASCAPMIRAAHPGWSEEEGLCREVISRVAGELVDDPPRRVVAVARLEAELQAFLCCPGTVLLRPAEKTR